MKAAVVTAYGEAPRYLDLPEPRAVGEHELVVEVLAAGLHPRVRMQAEGSHYTSSAEDLPLVPGIDGVGRGPDGRLWYFMSLGARAGSMAERTVIDTRRALMLPESTDPVTVAGTLNCAIASWLVLSRRIPFEKGHNVLILGATGGTGQMSVPVARHFGAGRVIAVGRDTGRLAALPGVDDIALLGDPESVARVGAEVDVVLDYVWGEPAVAAMTALVQNRPEPARPLTWVQLGEIAGAQASVPAGLLRSSGLQILGSGQGSLGTADMATEIPAVAAEIARGTFAMKTTAIALEHVEEAWNRPADSSSRIVLTAGS
ncbi:zinc-binding alcohol dehydrogenase family protein [Kineosporia mesophila]|uniref:Zinc-binding alcohol dehydrogenase family protein n=1 Tax=Kineosporia mesophila TaxID=566012 RepID=A0ABP7AKA7_9ACTN|nr:zinc-binding alcohol dehydrogenase family protein [Kineosporia mesophila]MCD5354050.1 zinc-binding alcohol dehydrogenase family protein [Kineosporia mesophila]